MKYFIQKALADWAYRVNDGCPDPHNRTHIQVLEGVLRQYGCTEQFISEYVTRVYNPQLTEDGKDDQYVHKSSGVWVKKGQEDNEDATRYEKTDDGQYKELEGEEESQEDSREHTKNMLTTPEPGSDAAEKGSEEDKKGEEDGDVGEFSEKDKSLKDIDTINSETYTNPDTGVDDEEFENGPINSIYENSEDELKSKDLDEYFKSGKVPKKYQTVIARLMNSTHGKQKITDYMSGVGAGQIQSQAGEIITMAGIGMDDDEFDGFISKLQEQVSKYPKGSKGVVTQDWLESVKYVRNVTTKRYDSKFGKGNWEVEASAWDVPGEFQALGNDNYTANKGFSSDMYVKVRVTGKPVLDEISLKKDTTANIFNGVVTAIKEWASNVPKSADIDEYKKGELERPKKYGMGAAALQVDRQALTSPEVMQNKELRQTLQALGVVSGDAKKGYRLEKKAEDIITKLESMPVPPPIDALRFKQTFGTSDKSRFKKYLIMHAACQRAKEISEGNTEKTTAFEFLNIHIGYEKGEDGKFPEGSIKRYQNDTIQFLVEDEEAKEGCLNALAEKLPMKALFEGEESMAIGGLSADPKTLKRIFGIDSYDEFKAGLTMKEDEDGNNFLVYSSQGPPATAVPIAEVKVRQKGQGYASSVGLEFQIAKDFGKALYGANKEEYPPEPEISKKERRKLGVD
ncbi:hypothetical protein N9Z73_00165 [bacterium]|nr:hypothetical protein [bacterium]